TDAGRLSLVIGGAGEETATTYDQGVLTDEVALGLTARHLTYDPDIPRLVGEIRTSADGSGSLQRQTAYAYDSLGRLSMQTEELFDGGSLVSSIVTGVDDRDSYGVPRYLSRQVDGALESELVRITDQRGRIRSEEHWLWGSQQGTASYAYSGGGRLSQLGFDWTGGGSTQLAYERDGADQQIARIVDTDSGTVVAQVAGRDAMGRISSLDLFGGAALDLDRDPLGRIHELWATATDGTVSTRRYTYDARGRLSERAVDDRVDTYAYREPGWLTQEVLDSTGASPLTTTTTYDAGGNRTSQTRVVGGVTTTDSYTIDGANRLVALDRSTDDGTGLSSLHADLGWDDLGGITLDHRGSSFTRGADGRVSQITDPGGSSVSIDRDPLGRPIALAESTGELDTLFWGNPQGQWPLAGTGRAGQERMWVGLEGMLVAFVDDGAILPAASDDRGDLLMLGDQLVGAADAFGADRDHLADTSERFVYAGTASVGDRPQLMAQHRLYDPELGRFLSADPLGLDGGFHRFAYAENMPTTKVDPVGLQAVDLSGLDWMGTAVLDVGGSGVWSGAPDGPWDWGHWGQACPVTAWCAADGGAGVGSGGQSIKSEIDGPYLGDFDTDGNSAVIVDYFNEEEGYVIVVSDSELQYPLESSGFNSMQGGPHEEQSRSLGRSGASALLNPSPESAARDGGPVDAILDGIASTWDVAARSDAPTSRPSAWSVASAALRSGAAEGVKGEALAVVGMSADYVLGPFFGGIATNHFAHGPLDRLVPPHPVPAGIAQYANTYATVQTGALVGTPIVVGMLTPIPGDELGGIAQLSYRARAEIEAEGEVLVGRVASRLEAAATEGLNEWLASEGSTIRANAVKGAAFEAEVGAALENTADVVAPQITVKTASGTRTRIDFVTMQADGTIGCVECKASATAPLTKNQKAAFPEIAESGATVVGKGKPGVPGGTQIPPTEVDIIRPE
ncbi:MAG: hypothetical protein D6798_01045, partial [Deltaproteobacteria bacterium]